MAPINNKTIVNIDGTRKSMNK